MHRKTWKSGYFYKKVPTFLIFVKNQAKTFLIYVKIDLQGRKRREQMKTVVLLYDTSCIYEIVILNYFLKVTGKEMLFVSPDGKEITATEGYRIVPEEQLEHVDPKDVELLIIPGGDIEKIDNQTVWEYLKSVHDLGGRIAAICAGVDVVEHAGLLEGIESTHSGEKDVVTSDRITTSRANGYVDFAIEVAKQMELFEDEADLQETIAFWREFQRME